MAKCPECGEPLVKVSKNGRYHCETEGCSVIFVERPSKPALRRVVRTALSKS